MPNRRWPRRGSDPCEVYWGSHGCMYERGHDGPHECECAFDESGARLPHTFVADNGNVGCPPYYGSDTYFYGDTARDLDLAD